MSRLTRPSAGVPRRDFLRSAGALGVASLIGERSSAWAAHPVELGFANGQRTVVSDFPQKGAMVLQRTRPPLLETPFEVFDHGVFTPNDSFYVRWHLAYIPTSIAPADFRLRVHGRVHQPLSLNLDELARDFPSVEMAAVNQCSGNSRGFFSPRVAGGEWGNGAMGNAMWRGVRLKDVLDRAGLASDAQQVRFTGLDAGVLPQTPIFRKSLALDHARDGEVMIAYAMNGLPLPLLNGFPIRLVVPGWFATYWVKMLSDIEVLDHTDDNYWMTKAYLIPDTPGANIAPGQQGVKMVPISRMLPRSFITSPADGAVLRRGAPVPVRGIAFGGDTGIARVQVSHDGGRSWQDARLGADHGKYSFRRWELALRFAGAGTQRLMVRAVNSAGLEQPDHANWNAGGYMRNVIESVSVQVNG